MKAEPRTPEFQRFDRAMRDILKVSKADLKQMLEEERIANAGKLKRGPKPKHSSSASGHASGEQG